MPTRRRSVAVVLGAIVAVLVVVVGATAAFGWRSDRGDPSAAGQSGRSVAPRAAPGPEEVARSPGLSAVVPAPPDAARDASLAGKPGTLVARGADLRVESVALAAPTTIEVNGVSRAVSSVYRVTISAGPYVVRDMPAIVSVDGAPIGVGAESVDLGSLVLFTFDDVVVTDGATVALSYGLPGQALTDWSTTLEVIQ